MRVEVRIINSLWLVYFSIMRFCVAHTRATAIALATILYNEFENYKILELLLPFPRQLKGGRWGEAGILVYILNWPVIKKIRHRGHA